MAIWRAGSDAQASKPASAAFKAIEASRLATPNFHLRSASGLLQSLVGVVEAIPRPVPTPVWGSGHDPGPFLAGETQFQQSPKIQAR